MGYTIEILKAADKFLAKLHKQQPDDARAIEDVIELLADEPRPTGCTPLNGVPGALRVRVGNYRVCSQVDDGRLVILVVTISTRDNVHAILQHALGR